MNELNVKKTLVIALGVIAMLPAARASEWNQKTRFTFSAPIAIPGQTLPAGSYTFKLLDSASNRNIVQVFTGDEKHLIGTFLAIPDYRLKPASKPIINFEERAEGQPEAIKAWFYPGRNYGHEFVYPKAAATALAKANRTPVPAMAEALTPVTTMPEVTPSHPQVVALAQAPLKAETPADEEVEVAGVFQVEAVELPAKLPETASYLPLTALAGLLCLGTAVTLRLAAGRAN